MYPGEPVTYAKDPAYEAIEQAGRRRIRGIAAQAFLLAFQLAHANQRKLTRYCPAPVIDR